MKVLKAFPRYWKAAVAALTPVFVACQAAVTDGEVTTTEWAAIAVALVAAYGVWRVPNAPKPEPHEPATDRTGM
ncbi:hypothetical protein [Streptomyces sp.]|uniref:hypothetical protein n=1 Tax=Streptomyces sp. TaxID=1931 RepID=UPI002F958B8F